MERIICEGELATEWSGATIGAPMRYQLLRGDAHLVYRAFRAAAPELHPQSHPGRFLPELWRYHCAELFLAPAAGVPYLEFNLAPNGAWWSRLYSSPRVPAAEQPSFSGVTAGGHSEAQEWKAELRIPLPFLAAHGISRSACRVCICGSLPLPERMRWLTAVPHDTAAKPDFHRPADWPLLPL